MIYVTSGVGLESGVQQNQSLTWQNSRVTTPEHCGLDGIYVFCNIKYIAMSNRIDRTPTSTYQQLNKYISDRYDKFVTKITRSNFYTVEFSIASVL